MLQLPKSQNCNIRSSLPRISRALVYEARQCNCLFMVIYYQSIFFVCIVENETLYCWIQFGNFQQPCFGETIKTRGSLLKRVYGLWKHRRLDAFTREPASLKIVSLLFTSMNQRSSEKQKTLPRPLYVSPNADLIILKTGRKLFSGVSFKKSSNEVINKEKYKRETGEVV